MSRDTRYVIECRHPDGVLDFAKPQPEDVFGLAAITGIDEDTMGRVVWRHAPDAMLTGMNLPAWPKFVDPRWSARVKTW